jgi:hypothetical protein
MSILIPQNLGYQKSLTLRTRFTAPNNTRIGYVVVGRPIQWDANDAIPTSIDTIQEQYEISNYLLGGKRITGNDVSLVIPRRTWTSNTTYQAYDDRVSQINQLATHPSLYVITADGNVYKCLENNNGAASTIEPTGNYLTNNGVIALGDGYVWKYMYRIEPTNKFNTSQWMPVPTEQNENYFGNANNVVRGAISKIVVESGGSGYIQANTMVVITGAGVSATATANVANGVITSISISNPGVNYTRQNSAVTVTGAGTGANVRLVLPDTFGHAFNPAQELGANTVMFSVKLGDGDATEGGKITANNDFRQIGLLMEPHKYGETVSVNIATANLVVTMITKMVLTSGTAYQRDERVYQGVSPNTASFSAYVSDVFTNSVELVGLQGTPIVGATLTGVSSGVARTVVSITNPDLEIGSGKLVYVENVSPVTRSIGQSEHVKIIVRY